MITFSSAEEAGRIIAGIPAAARMVRELAEAGFAMTWLDGPSGETIDARTLDDVHRLAGSMTVSIGSSANGEPVWRLPGTRLFAAPELLEIVAGRETIASVGLALDADASAQILRQAGKPSDGPVSKWLNRPVSRRISAILLRIPGFRPSHATAGTALLALVMFAALVAGGPTGLLIGGLLFHAASVFDGVDGEVARATFRESPFGSVFDSVVDVGASALLVVGLAINLDGQGVDEAVPLAVWGLTLLLAGLAILGRRSARAGGAFTLNHVKSHFRGRFAGALAPRLFAFFTVITSRDFFSLAAAICIVVNWPMVILYGLAVVTPFWIVFVLVSVAQPRRAAARERRDGLVAHASLYDVPSGIAQLDPRAQVRAGHGEPHALE